jgi:hypothetical protein
MTARSLFFPVDTVLMQWWQVTNGNVFDLISLVWYSHTAETLRPVRPHLEPRSITITLLSSGGQNPRDFWRINHHRRHTASDGNRIRIRGRTALVFVTYSLGNSRRCGRRHGICETSSLMRTCRIRGRSAARSRLT